MIPLAIDWTALVQVAITTFVVTLVVVTLVATAALALDTGHLKQSEGGSAGVLPAVGYVLLSVVGVLIVFGLYLIIPHFH